MTTFSRRYLDETARIAAALDPDAIERLAAALALVRSRGGRLFLLGVGGGAAHASHAVNDFRKLAGFEAYAPTDNVSELTARTNDEGWDTVFAAWLLESRLRREDAVFVLSVGGGSAERHVSENLVKALELARRVGCSILGIVGRDGGSTARVADACVIVPTVNAAAVTPHTEEFQAVIWHLLVSHPALQTAPARWESITPGDAGPPAIFLDRDGVLNAAVVRNGKPFPPSTIDELRVLPDVKDALARLKAAGYRLVVVTNQPDVARGAQTREGVEAINSALGAQLPIDEFRVCYHDDANGCACRKPKPGLLLREPRHDLARSAIVGDRGKDVEAGVQAGVGATVFIDRGYDEPLHTKPDASVQSLSEAADWILSRRREARSVPDSCEGSARGSSERESASEAAGSPARDSGARSLEKVLSASGAGVGSPQQRSVLDAREGSAGGSSERERASEASGGGAPRALEKVPSASGAGVGPRASKK
jgi:D-sedoheptulose 7-phosphate isomerase